MRQFEVVAKSKDSSVTSLLVRGGALLLALPYISVRYPVIFPLGLYAFLIPFDNVMWLNVGGTVTRYLGILVIVAFGANRIVVAKGRLLKPSHVVWGWATFLALAGLSTLWAVAPHETLSSLFTITGLFLIYFLVGVYPFTERDYSLLTKLIITGSTIAAIYVLVSHLRGITFPHSVRASLILGAGRTTDPNHLAASLILPLLLSFEWNVESRGVQKMLALASAVVIASGIFLTGSRGGMLGAAIALLVFFWRIRHRVRLRSITATFLSAVLLAGLILSFIPAPHQFIARLNPETLIESGGVHRFYIWRVGFKAFLYRPLDGYGYNNFPYAYELFRDVVPGNYLPYRAAHNIYLQTFAELGLIGGLLLLFIVWQHWRLVRRLARRNRLAIPLEAAFAGVMVTSATLGTLNYKYFWLLFTLVVLRAAIQRQTMVSQSPRRVDKEPEVMVTEKSFW